MSSNQTRPRFARAAVLAASVVVAIVSCSTENTEQERQSVASAALKAGEMPTLDPATVVFAEQLGSREPDCSIVAKLNQPSLTAFISSAALNQARSRSVTDAAADSISGPLPRRISTLFWTGPAYVPSKRTISTSSTIELDRPTGSSTTRAETPSALPLSSCPLPDVTKRRCQRWKPFSRSSSRSSRH